MQGLRTAISWPIRCFRMCRLTQEIAFSPKGLFYEILKGPARARGTVHSARWMEKISEARQRQRISAIYIAVKISAR
jgi:hypothetical protein